MKRIMFALMVICTLATASATTLTAYSGTQTVSVTLSTAAKVSVPSTVPLSTTGTTFNNFTGSQLVSYKARTTPSGHAWLSVKGTSSYLGTVSLVYTCGSATLGTACSGSQTVSTSSTTTVVQVGSSACVGTGCSSADPATITLSFTLANSPTYTTGSNSGTMQYTWALQ